MEYLVYRVIQGIASEEERASVRAWRRESPQNEEIYQDLRLMLTEAHAAAWADLGDALPPAVEDLISAPVDDEPVSIPRERSGGRVPTWGLGAAAAAGLAIIAFALQFFAAGSPQASVLGAGEVVTGSSEMTTLILGDETVVRLAPSSRLRISDAPGTREVWLEGHAYFAVTPREGPPFRVRSSAGDALVLGTRFDVRASPDDLRVLVVNGSVQLSRPDLGGEGVELGASQLGRVSSSLPPVQEAIDPEVLEEELRWLGNFLVFEGTPLSEVALELSRNYGISVEVVDRGLERETVRGLFVEESLEDVIEVICRAVAAECSIQASSVTIAPPGR